MASFEVIPLDHSSSGSFPSGDYSFLPEVSAPHCLNGTENHVNGGFDLTNMQSALATATPDLSVEEVNSRLADLVVENQSLKETLNQNNELMKNQMSVISGWRDQMILSKSQQEESLKMAKEKISLLEKENKELSENLSKLEQACETLKKEQCKNCKSLETILQSLQDENMSAETSKKVLVEELGGMAQFQEQFRQNLLAIYNQIHNLLRPSSKIPDKEKVELKALLQCLGTKIGILGGDFGATVQTDEETGYVVINKKVQQTSDYLLQNSSVIEGLKNDLVAKDKELDIFKKREQEMSEIIKAYEKRLEENDKEQKAKFELLSSKVQMESSLCETYKTRCDSLQQQIDEYQVKLEKAKMSDDHQMQQLREEAKNLQDILKLEQRANQRDKEKLAEVYEQCEKLQVDYERVCQLLEIQTRDEKMKNVELSTLRETSARNHMEEVDHLTAKLLYLEEKLGDKCEEVNKLKEELDTLKEESETIPILKAQVDVYKTDLEHAVSTRDTAHAEIEKLEKELKKYKRHDSDHSASGRRRSSHGHKKDEAEVIYQCPLCDMAFTNVHAIQNHVDQQHNT